MSTFGDKLKQLRTAAGMTQEELAKKCGITKQNISRYENSSREPNIRTAKIIADALNVPLADFAPETIAPRKASDEDRELLLTLFDQLPPESKEAVLVQLRALARYQKDQGDR